MTPTIPQRIALARNKMKEEDIDAIIVLTSDPHQSEYLAEHWKTREWLSGFTGSQGTLVVTQEFAGLWVDSRYYIQAEQELQGTGIEMQKQQVQGAMEYLDWLLDNMDEEDIVAVDGRCISVKDLEHIETELEILNIELVADLDLVGDIWKDRPSLPTEVAYEFAEEYAGQSRMKKLDRVIIEMLESEVDHYLLSSLDDIAWLLNIRSSDVECNPVCISYLLIGVKNSIWFVDQKKVPDPLRDSLKQDNIFIMDYSAIYEVLAELSSEGGMLLDPSTTCWDIYDTITDIDIVETEGLVMEMKSRKNEVEINHLREIMKHDGAAILRTERWLRNRLDNGEEVKETEVGEQLKVERAKIEGYKGESFDAIVGYNGNGAIVHYRAKKGQDATIKNSGILLVDSGGQYLRGTTDITRTWSLGEPTEEQKRNYTAVLKGHICLSSAVFPEGTMGVQLDILARLPLWKLGLNYGHGTGHGVGFFLNVHEPPQGFTPNTSLRGRTIHLPGMITSNEPGFYKEGEYGIRIENLILTQEHSTGFLSFANLTLYPFERDLIIKDDLNKDEIEWVNQYHQEVLSHLSPLLNDEEIKWLEEVCRPL